jgi:antitoxin CptB
MTGTKRSSDGLDVRRRRLLFRSWHRGLRELDLVLGTFADAAVDGLTDAEIEQYEQLLDVPDAEFLAWITGEESIPAAFGSPLLDRILASRNSLTF